MAVISTSPLEQDKILYHCDRINMWQHTGTCMPVTMEVDVTNHCNHKCPSCTGFNGNGASMSLENIKKAVDECFWFGVRGITFTGGGEPLCNKRFLEYLKYYNRDKESIHHSNNRFGLITNGGLITEEWAEEIVRAAQWIRISVDAGKPETYNRIHGVAGDNAFFDICHKISILTQKRSELGLEKECTIGIGVLTDESMSEEIPDAISVASKLGVDYIQFRPFHYNKYNIMKQINALRPKFETDKFKVVASEHKYSTMANGGFKREYGKCFGLHFVGVIQADMKMPVCCHLRSRNEYIFGDLNEKGLREIWYGPERRKIINEIDFRDCPPMCRADGFNKLLWNISKPKTHVNFL